MVRGEPDAALRSVLADEIGLDAVSVVGDSLVMSLPDQSALVAAVSRLHELGLSVHHVRSQDGAPGPGSADPDSPDPGLPIDDGAA